MVGPIESLLKLHKDLPKIKPPHERKIVKRQVAAADSQIDALMYGPYGLTEDEAGIVGAGWK